MNDPLHTSELPARGVPVALTVGQAGVGRRISGQVTTQSRRVLIVRLDADAELDGDARLEWGSWRGLAILEGPARTIADRTARIVLTGPIDYIQRRRYPRAEVVMPVTVTAQHAVRQGTTVDLGEGGMRCLIVGPRAPRGALVSSIVEAGGTRIEALGVVRRSVEAGLQTEIGLEFTQLLSGDADRIRREVFVHQVRRRHQGVS